MNFTESAFCESSDYESQYPTFIVYPWDSVLRRTRTTLLVGYQQLLQYIAALGPANVDDRAGGFPLAGDASVMCVPLQDGQVALIDAEDYPLVRPYAWQHNRSGYATTIHVHCGLRSTYRMHRLVMLLGADDPREPDHINHDALDNRKANLRPATRQQNACNQRLSAASTTGIKGVHRYGKKWRGLVALNRRQYARIFDTAAEAEAWVIEKRKELHGEFACHG